MLIKTKGNSTPNEKTKCTHQMISHAHSIRYAKTYSKLTIALYIMYIKVYAEAQFKKSDTENKL